MPLLNHFYFLELLNFFLIFLNYFWDERNKFFLQLLPYFVLEKISSIPGITGLFIASVYSAGTRLFFICFYFLTIFSVRNSILIPFIFSTLSASYSALSAVVIEDVIKQYLLKLRNGKQLDIKVAIRLTKVLRWFFFFLLVHLILNNFIQ